MNAGHLERTSGNTAWFYEILRLEQRGVEETKGLQCFEMGEQVNLQPLFPPTTSQMYLKSSVDKVSTPQQMDQL